jgi:UDP-hydrolysing UDP-N-acetyl-D-glucosamine 2-epimerase
MRMIQEHPELELQTIATGTMVLERFGRPVELVRDDGFSIDAEVFSELEGSTPNSMAKSLGFALVEFASEFNRLKPDLVLLIGDRYEALAAAIAAAYMNLCIVHIQGGEVSGSIDESARHAISKFAHFHFPATERAREYLLRMGETPESILGVGCPSSDIASQLDRNLDPDHVNAGGSGITIDLTKPFLLSIYHPTTTAYGSEAREMIEVLEALDALKMPSILLWPNIDAGADHISKTIRVFRDERRPTWLRVITNLPPEPYLKLLALASCAVGNSSSFVRDASFFGTPVVLVGDRQKGRETDISVTTVPPHAPEIVRHVQLQLAHGRYPASTLYGDGEVSRRIAGALARLTPYVQKRLHFVYEGQRATPIHELASTWHRNGARGFEGNPAKEHTATPG